MGRLYRFLEHPYKVEDNEEMEALAESIREQGVLTPLLVRRVDGSETDYELISGHRRAYAAAKAGLESSLKISWTTPTACKEPADLSAHKNHLDKSKSYGRKTTGNMIQCWYVVQAFHRKGA